MPEPTEAARAIRLKAIRERSDTAQETILSHLCDAVIDRRWLLGEVGRLTRERDDATERLNDMLLDHREKDQ